MSAGVDQRLTRLLGINSLVATIVCARRRASANNDAPSMGKSMGWPRGAHVARLTNRLKAVEIKGLKAEGLYADGGGLYLRCTSSGSQSWIYRYRADGKLRDMGLGPVSGVPLAKARQLAGQCARQRRSGIDSIRDRHAQRAAAKLAEARGATFKACAEELIASRESGWSNAKHRQQWIHSLRDYVYPLIGDTAVSAIDTDLVLAVLQQPATGDEGKASTLWVARTETASRVRSRIEAALSYAAKVKKAREGENPAQWRGHLDQYLPPRAKVRSVQHQPALPFAEIPVFMAQLRARESTTAHALEFTILCAARWVKCWATACSTKPIRQSWAPASAKST
jgi:hypothetical protein